MRKLLALLPLLPALAWAGTNATLYVRSTQTHLNPSYDVEVARGSSAANSGALTCVGATPSTFRTYYSEAATGTAVLNGNITGSIWSAQSNAGCNNGGRITVSRRTSDGTETQICVATGYAEFANGGTTATAASLGTCAASSFTINSGDRLKVVLDRVQIGTGGTTRNSTLYWDGPTAAQSGDTYITLPQCVPGITDTCTADASATLVGIAGTGALGGTVTSTGEATRTLAEVVGTGALGGTLDVTTSGGSTGTFGRTSTTGLSAQGLNFPPANNVSGCEFTLSSSGDVQVTKLSVIWQSGLSAPSAHVKGVIYSASADWPVTLLGVTNEQAGVTGGVWTDLTFASPVTLSPGNYFLGVIADTNLPIDSETLGYNRYVASAYPTPPATWGGGATSGGQKPIYATYTTSGGDASATLVGVSGTGALGGTISATGTASRTLTGIIGSGALGGALSSSGTATRTLTEITGSGALGGLLSYSTADVTDASATLVAVAGEGALGTLTSTGAATLTISEISGTGAVGLLDYAASASATLTEITGTAVLGALSLAGDAMCGLVGLAGEGALGLLSATDQVNAAVHLLGISGVGALGHLYVTESLIKMMEEGTCGGVRGGGGTLERPKTGGSNE